MKSNQMQGGGAQTGASGSRLVLPAFGAMALIAAVGLLVKQAHDSEASKMAIDQVVGIGNCGEKLATVSYKDKLGEIHQRVAFHGRRFEDIHGNVYAIPEMRGSGEPARACAPLKAYLIPKKASAKFS